MAAETTTTRTVDKTDADSTASTLVTAESRRFIQKAARSGLKEVRLSRLATQRSTTPAVRDFAQMLIEDHQQANVKLATIARMRGIDIPPVGAAMSMSTATTRSTTGGQAGTQAPAGGADSIRVNGTSTGYEDSGARDDALKDIAAAANKLEKKSGAEFDRAFLEGMIRDHNDAIALFEDARKRTGDDEISQFAEATLPKLRAHLSRAESLHAQLKS